MGLAARPNASRSSAPAPQTWTADNSNGTYSNPLCYEEFEDPDIIRMGNDYYLAGTTMHITSHQARLRGTHQALTPVVDVARDPRWGRVEETYGEDPYLNTQLGIAAVRGFQGFQGVASFRKKRHVIAASRRSGSNLGRQKL